MTTSIAKHTKVAASELEARRIALEEAEKYRAETAEFVGVSEVEVRLDTYAIRRIARVVNEWAHSGPAVHIPVGTVGKWVNERNRHSPWIDWVAIERALAWDLDVIARLTDLEREEFVHQLAIDLDPWGEAAGDIRRERFLSQSERDREAWRYLVAEERSELSAA